MCLVCMTHGVPLQVSFPRPVSLYENCSIADETPAPPAGENQLRYPSPVSSLSLKYNYDFYASTIQRKLYFTLTWLLKIKKKWAVPQLGFKAVAFQLLFSSSI